MLGADGYMFSGIITDQNGYSYLLEVEHNGHFGRMITVNGAYTVNGKIVYLTFNQNHDGNFGAITFGLSELRSTGVSEKVKNQDGQVVNQSQNGRNNGNQQGGGTGNSGQQSGDNGGTQKKKSALDMIDENAQKTYYVDEEAANRLQSVMNGL